MNKIIQAAQFADLCHRGQFRKYTNEPYIIHPARVAGRFSIHKDATEDGVCASWLHDVIEDCSVKEKEIASLFGSDVAKLVSELTNKSKDLKLKRAERKQLDRDKLVSASHIARVIKLIDRIDNLKDMKGCEDDFLNLYKRESLLLVDVLLGTDPELERELIELAKV